MIIFIEFGDRIGPNFPKIFVPPLLRSNSTGPLEVGSISSEEGVPGP